MKTMVGTDGGVPRLRDLARRLGWGNLIDGTIPVVAFVALDQFTGMRWAVIGTTILSVAVALLRRRKGNQASPLLWLSLAFLLARGIVGAITRSKIAYFGPGIATAYVAAVIFLGSVVIGRPAIEAATRFIFGPLDARADPRRARRIFNELSLAWGVYEVLNATLQVWLLGTVSAGTFMVARQVINTGGSLPLIAWSLFRLRQVIKAHGQEYAAPADAPAPAAAAEAG